MVGDYSGLLQMIAGQRAEQQQARRALDDSVLGGLQDVGQGVSIPVEPAVFYKNEDGIVPSDRFEEYVTDSRRLLNGPYGYEVYSGDDPNIRRIMMEDQPLMYPISDTTRWNKASGEFAKKGK